MSAVEMVLRQRKRWLDTAKRRAKQLAENMKRAAEDEAVTKEIDRLHRKRDRLLRRIMKLEEKLTGGAS